MSEQDIADLEVFLRTLTDRDQLGNLPPLKNAGAAPPAPAATLSSTVSGK